MVKTRRKSKEIIVAILIVLLIIIILIVVVKSYGDIKYKSNINKLKENSFEIDASEIALRQNFVYLRLNECEVLEIATTPEQTAKIQQAINKARDFRPGKENLIYDILGVYNINLEFVFVEKVIEGAFVSKLFLKQGNKVAIIDSKTTDALILAYLSDSDIYVNKELKNVAGNIC